MKRKNTLYGPSRPRHAGLINGQPGIAVKQWVMESVKSVQSGNPSRGVEAGAEAERMTQASIGGVALVPRKQGEEDVASLHQHISTGG